MASPHLDEGQILCLLDCPVDAEHVNMLQAGAAQALIDVFDRKVTRDHFIEMMGECLALYGQAAKMWMLQNVKYTHDEVGVTDDNIKRAMVGITSLVDKQAEAVQTVVKKLMQCPMDEDPIH